MLNHLWVMLGSTIHGLTEIFSTFLKLMNRRRTVHCKNIKTEVPQNNETFILTTQSSKGKIGPFALNIEVKCVKNSL